MTDTVRGMTEQQLAQIFRPFYTTRSNGTGLGLSLVRRIVDDHRGQIDVTSEPGKGSTLQGSSRSLAKRKPPKWQKTFQKEGSKAGIGNPGGGSSAKTAAKSNSFGR